ncbi:centromere protein H-like [Gouania willdenowi]|uniref:Centromere protein H-like n=1 Tax=Gouania willdenowi TaxID=441366 RepID=A0A8C5I914_GOUWI|nr:centromere protein H-like [Gouania willdenowi]
MDSDTENLNNAASSDCTNRQDTSTADMLRMQQQMSNQCFEMSVQLNAGKSKRCCSTSEAERDLPDYMNEVEKVKTAHFTGTLALHRIQMWNAIGEKLREGDSVSLRVMIDRYKALCSHIKQLQQESKTLQDEIIKLQKHRLELKRLTHERMKQTEELASKMEHPDTHKYKAAVEKGQANLEKYRRMTVMTQNVLRGILLACKVNWMDDPEVQAIAMTLED